MDAYLNFAYGLVATAATPPTTGNSLVLQAGHGARFPPVPFNAVIWPIRQIPDPTNAEIVTCTALAGDTFTLLRAQEGTTPRIITSGDQIAATLTKKMLDDLVAPTAGGRFLVQQARADLPQAQALSALATGYLRSTNGTGVVTSLAKIPTADLPTTIPYTNGANIFTAPQTLSPNLIIQDLAQPANQRNWLVFLATGDCKLHPLLDDTSLVPGSEFIFRQNGSFSIFGDLVEKGRGAPLGHWVQIPYSGSNFTASVGTLSFPSGSIFNYSYTLIGKTMLLTFYATGGTVSGGGTELRIALPIAAQTYCSNSGRYFDGAAYSSLAEVVSTPGTAYLTVYKDRSAQAVWAATNALMLFFTATIPLP